jgi:hypothetical protein
LIARRPGAHGEACALKDPARPLDTGRVASVAQHTAFASIRADNGPRPLYAFLLALNVVLIGLGLILGHEKHPEDVGAGTGLYQASGPDPNPALDDYYWHVAFPDSYSALVHKGVPLYLGAHQVGRVAASAVDGGSVWAYYTVFPRFEWAMGRHNEMEPVQAAGGPRIMVYPKGGGEETPGPARPPRQIGGPLS